MKSFKHFLLILAISVLPFAAVFADPQMIHTHDGPMHIARIPAYLNALQNGQILPRWASYLNYGYGMPLFNFYYHLPYLLGSLFLSTGMSLALTFKVLLFLSFLLSGIWMYQFAALFFRDDKRAWVATVLYLFAPFHLVDLVVRGDIGETLAMSFLPLVLYFIVVGFRNKKFSIVTVSLTGISAALLILSHSAIGLIYFGIATLFAIVFAPSNQKRLEAGYGLGLGVLLTTFFWLPIVYERKYTYGDFFMKDMYKSHFAPMLNFFIPNVTNSTTLQNGGVDVSFGLIQTIALLMGIFALIKHRLTGVSKTVIWFGVVLTAVALFAMTSGSSVAWERVSILRAFQFPWRMLTITVFSLSLVGSTVLISKSTPKLVYISIIAITMLSSIVYWKPPLGFDRINEAYFKNYPLDSTFFGETNLVWSAGPARSYPKAPFELIGGRGKIINIVKLATKHTFTVIAQSPVQILDNTQYYPGWRVSDNSLRVPIEFQDQNHRGLITFTLPQGTHHITVSFRETPLRQISDFVSVVTLTSIVIIHSVSIVKRKGTGHA